MIVLHSLPGDLIASIPVLDLITSQNRPQLLFAILDGVSLGIISQGLLPDPNRSAVKRQVASRGVFLIALGLFLSSLNSGVVIILDYYGIFFILALPLLFAPLKVVATCAVFLAIFGPVVVGLISHLLDGRMIPFVLQQTMSWLFTGQYPAVTWMAFVLAGLWMIRFGVSRMRPYAALGMAVCALAIQVVLSTDPQELHPIAREIGENSSSGMLAMVLLWALVAALRPAQGRKWSLRMFRSISAMGIMPLTTYSLHVVAMSMLGLVWGIGSLQGWQSFWIILSSSVILAFVFELLLDRGPLEMLTRWLSSGAALERSMDVPAPVDGLLPVDATGFLRESPINDNQPRS
ncbi:hypothetical protein [Microbacterium sp. NPDC057650]|uniref:hypothetical protein n=1 Tax=unclassified Microbacterium TaxID=2609290 RepID=UPI00366E1E66